ncbi:MAG: hypothetical protein JWP31_714 [Aeromicrobium sp.]|nr:hypothetical protein [Aeromicrobium sp.]
MSGYTIGEIGVWLVLAASLGFVLGWLVRDLSRRIPTAAAPSPAAPTPAPPVVAQPVVAVLPVPDLVVLDPAVPLPAVWVPPAAGPAAEPPDDGGPPTPDHVVKGKTRSMIYHAPGTPAYQRTVADTWFRTAADAEAAGFRKPKNA